MPNWNPLQWVFLGVLIIFVGIPLWVYQKLAVRFGWPLI